MSNVHSHIKNKLPEMILKSASNILLQCKDVLAGIQLISTSRKKLLGLNLVLAYTCKCKLIVNNKEMNFCKHLSS